MAQEMHKFPSIEQLRHVIENVKHRAQWTGKEDENGDPIYDEEAVLPTLNFIGTVKLHGTNAAIVYTWNHLEVNYDVHAQSRTRIITPTSDNAGFAAFVATRNTEKILSDIMRAVVNEQDLGYTPEAVKVYGEWCGGNIQKGVAINGLDKMFVIFGIKIDKMWVSDSVLHKIVNEDEKIYNILHFPTYEMEVNFNEPKVAADKMGKLVEQVEKECPVGKEFDSIGVGEGIVWRCINKGYEGSKYWFKTKGDEHKSSGSKEKVAIAPEIVAAKEELVGILVTESRLRQGLDHLRENNLKFDRSSTGPYVKWVYEDVIKEELDTIMANGFEPKEISSMISNKARKWFFDKIDVDLGL